MSSPSTSTRTTSPATLRRGLAVIGRGFAQQRLVLFISVIGSAAYGILTVLTSRVVGHLTGTVVEPVAAARSVTAGQLWTIVWQLGLVVLLTAIAVMIRRIAAGVAFFNLQAIYRRRVSAQYLRLPLSWHQRHPSGQLLSNANADVEATWNVFQPLPMAIGVLVMLAVAGYEMVRTDVALALVGLLVFPALFAVNLVFQSVMSPRVTRVQQLRAEVSEVAHESIEAGLLVKAMGREEQESARFAERTDELRDAAIRMGRTRAAFDPLIDAIPNLGTLAVLVVGTYRVASGHLDAAEVVQIAYLFSVLAFPVRAFGWVLADLPRSVIGWNRVNAVLTARGEMPYGDQAPAQPRTGAQTYDEVSYAYQVADRAVLGSRQEQDASTADRVPAVRRVSLDLSAGRTVALVGPTGSGKSTLSSLALRLMDPDAGTITLDGVDLRDLRAGGVQQVATLVAQQPFLFDDTVAGNVTLGADLDTAEVERALQVAQAHGFVAELPDGMDTRVGERGASLSGGQRQRIALARAVVRDPALLVLDDSTSAVDPAVETAILDALRARSAEMTVLVVAYRLSTIGMADEVLYMQDGQILDRGSHQELLQRCTGYRHVVTAYAREAAERAAVAATEEPMAGDDDE